MAAYRQSQSICRALYTEAALVGKGLSMSANDLFCKTLLESTENTVAALVGKSPAMSAFDLFRRVLLLESSDEDIFDADLLFTESLRYALSEGRIVALEDGTYALPKSVSEDMAPKAVGVISTNVDSRRCGICDEAIVGPQLDTVDVLSCCGRRICADCHGSDREIATNRAGERVSCSVCGEAAPASVSEKKRNVRRLAKRAPWAAHILGTARYDDGEFAVGSPYDAVRYLRKAASAGNPEALFHLGRHLSDGCGCIQNLQEALVCLDRCVTIDPAYTDCVSHVLVSLSGHYLEKKPEVSEALLEKISITGNEAAQYILGTMYQDPAINLRSEDIDGQSWQLLSALNRHMFTYFVALRFFQQKKYAQARFFLEWDAGQQERQLSGQKKDYEALHEGLLQIKENCGWCGVPLPVKRNRKTCRQCLAVCYCSRSCQKYHWNSRSERSHRNDCKDVAMFKLDCGLSDA
mmetsp:Transcript_3837/g.10854  ORF Transcript_3837/g.10854 Transcript_3837/m.10854 type:complete len:465 (+) Transcript_3837:403-1797(+)|eukprot:CAMPEP_0181063422 /NCGR_PEP_ID=MMETSP1070-20121207/23636_1 /TAXON_ID=265543 /ORGANISM="Minutocellus polymorphus, Strain NH13" /LENGTH=464 /DNA_ID=CAMNT_0023143623 /DNA_START=274 /DNA_END=1668 /DNA_ORIENTATION=-